MYELNVKTHFDAAHFLNNYEGKCANLHGHRWEVIIKVEGYHLNKIGMLIDFKEIKYKLKPIIEEYDHNTLNTLSPFNLSNPTAEVIARTIYMYMKYRMEIGIILKSVTIYESPDCWAEYYE